LVKFHELGKIELGLLEDLDLSDENVLKREDLGASLGDFLANLFRNKLLEEFLKRALLDCADHSLHHLLADLLLLGGLSVASSLNLVLSALSESDREHTHKVTISSLSLHESLDKRVPLLDKRAESVTSDVHAVEVGVAIETFNFFDLDLDLAPGKLVGVVVELTERDGEDTATEGVSSDLLTSSLVTGGQCGHSHIKDGGNVHIVPLFLVEGVHNFLAFFRLTLCLVNFSLSFFFLSFLFIFVTLGSFFFFWS